MLLYNAFIFSVMSSDMYWCLTFFLANESLLLYYYTNQVVF